jgi:hypothetical protein
MKPGQAEENTMAAGRPCIYFREIARIDLYLRREEVELK